MNSRTRASLPARSNSWKTPAFLGKIVPLQPSIFSRPKKINPAQKTREANEPLSMKSLRSTTIRADASNMRTNASASAQTPEPEPEPELPPPPKFQFGIGNPLYEVALDFHSYRDKRSILDRLTNTQRQAIFKLLEDNYSEERVADLLAKVPPAGLSIQVSRAAVNRFRKRYQKQERRRNSVAFMREFKRILNAADGDD